MGGERDQGQGSPGERGPAELEAIGCEVLASGSAGVKATGMPQPRRFDSAASDNRGPFSIGVGRHWTWRSEDGGALQKKRWGHCTPCTYGVPNTLLRTAIHDLSTGCSQRRRASAAGDRGIGAGATRWRGRMPWAGVWTLPNRVRQVFHGIANGMGDVRRLGNMEKKAGRFNGF
jgi:hypothetical protein